MCDLCPFRELAKLFREKRCISQSYTEDQNPFTLSIHILELAIFNSFALGRNAFFFKDKRRNIVPARYKVKRM